MLLGMAYVILHRSLKTWFRNDVRLSADLKLWKRRPRTYGLVGRLLGPVPLAKQWNPEPPASLCQCDIGNSILFREFPNGSLPDFLVVFLAIVAGLSPWGTTRSCEEVPVVFGLAAGHALARRRGEAPLETERFVGIGGFSIAWEELERRAWEIALCRPTFDAEMESKEQPEGFKLVVRLS